jgi:NitT/TauT family transport system substrate-binding protein
MDMLRDIRTTATRFVMLSLFWLLATASANAQALKPFVVTEPVHSLDSIPFYIAIKKGYFRELGLDVQILTTEGGGRHIAAVLSGDAQAFIGGPEHLAFAKAKGGRDIRAVASMSNRANQYLVAARSLTLPDGSLGAKLKDKRIAVTTRGGTGYSIISHLLAREKLDPQKDLTLVEIAASGGRMAAVRASQADIALLNEPLITQGVKQGVFSPPFLAMPQELGPFAYTTVNVPADLIKKDPKLIQGLGQRF